MNKGLKAAKLGIFIFIGSTLLVIAIFLLGNKDALFQSTFTVKAYFNNIQGLRDGAPVRFGGIDVGSVKNITIVNDKSGRILVTMRVRTDVQNFIRKDSEASIETEGLVGNKVVIITMGSEDADIVKDGGTILSTEPLSFADVIEETQGILSYTKEMTKDLSEIIGRINRGEGTIGKILKDDELYYTATNLTRSAEQSLNAITDELNQIIVVFESIGSGVEEFVSRTNSVMVKIDTVITDISEGKGVLGSILAEDTEQSRAFNDMLTNLNSVTQEAKESASKLSENMEALKHNWLFKSYFEERGYWDKMEYEEEIDEKVKELNEKMEMLDEKINELRSLEKQAKEE